ncbi:T9SS type B sorting domain-containing protein [Galbibacter mesophilus]|uniref:T9SS type B sorting domain-containing protein n=1 Tax=Galbibacter mesophilus TaxID=379069 RepID=UPI00191E1222|nr:T9SS type B sorting domain-containing protein [Galbibacter mesophilus]MCM5663958.1 T9SS type B sorting domain-containing protein [Galbibacter mesophilus]
MRIFCSLTVNIVLLAFSQHILSQNEMPNDCKNAITVCGSSKISSNANGQGLQELRSNNACASFEHNSLWLKVNIVREGTLGFTLRPTSKNLEVDYDFFIFGPTSDCDNLGTSIRCSTTNPIDAGLTSNVTGMNDQETDLAEGPGELGNSFVKSLDVQVGDTYYIVIDRPIGDSAFEIDWTGTSLVGGSPFPPMPMANSIPNERICNDSGVYTVDLDSFSDKINTEPTNTVTYFENEMDASDDIAPLENTLTLNNESKTIYARVTNVNGCFDITNFTIASYKSPEAVNATLTQCDLDVANSTDGITVFNLNQANSLITSDANTTTTYYLSVNDRVNNTPIQNPDKFTGQEGQVISATVRNSNQCRKDVELTLSVKSTTASLQKMGPYFSCDMDKNDAMVAGSFNIDEIKNRAYPNLDVSLFNSREDASLELNEITSEVITTESTTLYVRIEDNNQCQDVEELRLVVDEIPEIELPKAIPTLCLNNPTVTIAANGGLSSYQWSLIKDDGTEEVVSNSQVATLTEVGEYILEVEQNYTSFGVNRSCSNSEKFTVNPSNVAKFNSEPIVEDISDNNRITVLVEGEGDYEYSLNDISGPYQDSNEFNDVPKGFVEVYVRDKNGCGVVSKTISVIGYNKFFTPNGDNVNDYWQLAGINAVTQANSAIYIFDRHGRLIKELDPKGIGWDGTCNGVMLPSTDYWFRVLLEDGREFKGHFSLKR